MKIPFSVKAALALTAVLSFCACEKEHSPSGSISSRTIIPMVEAGEMTKAGGVQFIDDLKSGFRLDMVAASDYYDAEGVLQDAGNYATRTVKYNGSAWAMDAEAYWINDVQLDFWAYNPTAISTCDITAPGAGDALLGFSYPAAGHTPDAQTDLLFAHTSKTHESTHAHTSGDSYDQINLSFMHAMAKIDIEFNLSGSIMPTDYQLESISLNGLKTSGRVVFNSTYSTFAWSDLSGSSSFTDDYSDSKYSFIVVPQDAAASNATMQLRLIHATKAPILLSAPLTCDMNAGKYYKYKATVHDGKELSISFSVADWNHEKRNLDIKEQRVTGFLNKDSYGNGIIDSESNPPRIYIDRGQAITGSFQLSSPKGAKLLLALDGNLDAFEVEPKITFIDDNPVNFTIKPLVHDPKIDYKTKLHIYLINPDASVTELDSEVMKENSVYKHYEIVLAKQ